MSDSKSADSSPPDPVIDSAQAAAPLGPPFPLDISISGFREDLCGELANYVASIVKEMMSILDLHSLEKIWLTSTYGETLASIDRGIDNASPLTPTKEDFAILSCESEVSADPTSLFSRRAK